MVTDGARVPLCHCYQVVSRMLRNVGDFLSEMSLIKLGEQTLWGHTSPQKAMLASAGPWKANAWDQPCWNLLTVKTESRNFGDLTQTNIEMCLDLVPHSI